MDEALIMEIWDTFKEYISDKNKDMAAAQYVDYLLGKEIETSVLEALVGYDSHLDDAIKQVLSDESVEEDADFDYGDEEEDY